MKTANWFDPKLIAGVFVWSFLLATAWGNHAYAGAPDVKLRVFAVVPSTTPGGAETLVEIEDKKIELKCNETVKIRTKVVINHKPTTCTPPRGPEVTESGARDISVKLTRKVKGKDETLGSEQPCGSWDCSLNGEDSDNACDFILKCTDKPGCTTVIGDTSEQEATGEKKQPFSVVAKVAYCFFPGGAPAKACDLKTNELEKTDKRELICPKDP